MIKDGFKNARWKGNPVKIENQTCNFYVGIRFEQNISNSIIDPSKQILNLAIQSNEPKNHNKINTPKETWFIKEVWDLSLAETRTVHTAVKQCQDIKIKFHKSEQNWPHIGQCSAVLIALYDMYKFLACGWLIKNTHLHITPWGVWDNN